MISRCSGWYARSMRWYCPACQNELEASDEERCPECGAQLRRDRRIFEPDLPAMGRTPSDEWVAVYQPRDGDEADAVQEYLEGRGIPTLQMPGIADWVHTLEPEERQAIVHLAVPRASADDARDELAALQLA
jgi:hypothetical protein